MIALVASAYAEPAVLLGVSDQRGALSTWWVTPTAVQKLGSGLAVPRPDGWWRVDVVVWDVAAFHEEDLRRVAPDGTVFQPPFSVTHAVGVTGRLVERVQAVGTDWWSLESVFDTTDDVAHLVGIRPSVEAFDPRTGDPALPDRPIRELLPAAEPAFVAAAEVVRTASDCLSYPTMTAWGVRRAAGAWQVFGRLHESWQCPPASPDFAVAVPAPAGFGSEADAPFAPGVGTPLDAVAVGPGARLLVKADGLALVAQGDETFEVAVAGPRVVMIRPAPSGDEAAFRAAAVKRLRQ